MKNRRVLPSEVIKAQHPPHLRFWSFYCEWEARALEIAKPDFPEQVRTEEKSRRKAQHPVISPIVIACSLEFFKEQ